MPPTTRGILQREAARRLAAARGAAGKGAAGAWDAAGLACLRAGWFHQAGPALRRGGACDWARNDLTPWRKRLLKRAAGVPSGSLADLATVVFEHRLAAELLPEPWVEAIAEAERRAAEGGAPEADWHLARLWAWTEEERRLEAAVRRALDRADASLPPDAVPALRALRGLAPEASRDGLDGWLADLDEALVVAPAERTAELSLLRVRLVSAHDREGEAAWRFRRGLPRLGHLLWYLLSPLWHSPPEATRPEAARPRAEPEREEPPGIEGIPAICELLTGDGTHPDAPLVPPEMRLRAARSFATDALARWGSRFAGIPVSTRGLADLDAALDAIRAERPTEDEAHDLALAAGCWFGELVRRADPGWAWLDGPTDDAISAERTWHRRRDRGMPRGIAGVVAAFARRHPGLREATAAAQAEAYARVVHSARKRNPDLAFALVATPYVLVAEGRRRMAPVPAAFRRLSGPPGLPLAEIAARELPGAPPVSDALRALREEVDEASVPVGFLGRVRGLIDGLAANLERLSRAESAAFAAGDWEVAATCSLQIDLALPGALRVLETAQGDASGRRALRKAIGPALEWSAVGPCDWGAPADEPSLRSAARRVLTARLHGDDPSSLDGLDVLRTPGRRESADDALARAAALHWLGDDASARAAWVRAAERGPDPDDPRLLGTRGVFAPDPDCDVAAAAARLGEAAFRAREDGDPSWRELALLRLRLHVLRDPDAPTVRRFALAYPSMAHLTA